MTDQTSFSAATDQIIEAGHFLYGQGWSPATSSNYSVRLDEQTLAITASGKHKGRLRREDIVKADMDGQLLDGAVHSGKRSSAETALHTGLYRHARDIGAVLHTHSPAATILSKYLQSAGAFRVQDYEMQKALGRTTHESELVIPIFPNTQNIDALALDVDDWMKANPDCAAYLIAGHGLYTWAADMNACLRHIEALEFICSCELELLKLAGT